MIKTKTFVVRKCTGYDWTADAAEELDNMIREFIEEKTAECTSFKFKVINIQYRPTIVARTNASSSDWYPSAMIVYDEA